MQIDVQVTADQGYNRIMKNTILVACTLLPFIAPALVCAFVLQPIPAMASEEQVASVQEPGVVTLDTITVVGRAPAAPSQEKKVVVHHMPKRVVREVTCDPVVYVLGGSYQNCR